MAAGCGDGDDAPGVCPVHQPLRTAQDLDPLDARTGQLLEVGSGLGGGGIGDVDAVYEDLGAESVFAADPDGGRAAGAARVADRDGRFIAQHIGQVVEATGENLFPADHRDGGADLAQGNRYP